jgi:hypothetical protein
MARIIAVLVPILLVAVSLSSRAEDGVPFPIPQPARIQKAAGAIEVDGDLSDEGWKGALEVSKFYEIRPGDNTEPKVKTVAWAAYDERFLYLAIRCDDPDPSKIRAPYLERDQPFSDIDFCGIMLDSRGDRRWAYELFVNARGIQHDLVMNDATGNEDSSPDFFWDAAAKITERGWQTEMRIPFSSLRYAKADAQTMNFLFYRNYPRDFRYQICSSPLPRGSNCFVCRFQSLEGFQSLPSAGHLVVAPYIAGNQAWESLYGPGSPLQGQGTDFQGGVDVKWSPNADNAVDATINPDFSQIESDTAQITVNQRFALFYPEKRPFFMEGVDLFQTPFNAVYTRTITSPRWGLRATGNVFGTDYTILTAEDRGGGSVIIPGTYESTFAPQDFGSYASILRARHSLGKSFVGFLITDRENQGGSFNRVAGPDFLWSLSDADRLTGQYLFSWTQTPARPDLNPAWDGGKLDGGAASLRWTHDTKTWSWWSLYEDVASSFRADDGYMPRVGYRLLRGNLNYAFYPKSGFFSQILPTVYGGNFWERNGRGIGGHFMPGVEFSGKGGLNGGLYYDYETDRVNGVYFHRSLEEFYVSATPSRVLSRVSFEAHCGQQLDYANTRVGHGGDVNGSFTVRPMDRLSIDFSADHQWQDSRRGVHQGRLYTADVARLKGVFTFSARSFLRAIVQWSGVNADPKLYPYPMSAKSGALNASILYTYRINWQTVLYVGYGDDKGVDPFGRLRQSGRQVFFKVSYAWQR